MIGKEGVRQVTATCGWVVVALSLETSRLT